MTINYRATDRNLEKAWFAYKAANPGVNMSIASFATGWNASKESIKCV